MNNISKRKQQQGIALIATLLVVIIFTVIGMNIANNGKKNQEMTGANVRNNIVFEASEMSLRRAIRFIRAIRNGEPSASDDASLTKNESIKKLVENFNIDAARKNSVQFVTNPAYAFVWKTGAIRKKVCRSSLVDCSDRFDFVANIDNKDVWKYAIKSTFDDSDDTFGENYLSQVETYTFIELLRDASVNTSTYDLDGNFTGGAGRGYYYLITVKGSGFPPGTEDTSTVLGRENIILQTVYAQKY